ncbi:MAG TPA: acyltransferase [Candidatus Baltobacteraceae bacterium]|nr:acyltransferase [Candidatus Baltobacteraceae bacterium]
MIAAVKALLSAIEGRFYGFRRFGRGAIIKPFPRRIAGTQYIEIGDECFFGDGLLLVATDKYLGVSHEPVCTFGDRCVFGSDAVISCTHSITIGSGVLTSSRVYIGDSYHGYEDISVPVLDQPMTGEAPIVIGDGTFLGIGAAILPGVTLGRNCYVGANAVVTKSFGDYSVVAGVPARLIRRYDVELQKWVST